MAFRLVININKLLYHKSTVQTFQTCCNDYKSKKLFFLKKKVVDLVLTKIKNIY